MGQAASGAGAGFVERLAGRLLEVPERLATRDTPLERGAEERTPRRPGQALALPRDVWHEIGRRATGETLACLTSTFVGCTTHFS